LENQCFLVSSNSVGLNNGTLLVGHSAIVDPWGIIRNSGGDDEVILKAEFDMAELETARERFPALADRKNWLNLEV
jgi:predicted amidohydrolase